MITGSNTNVRHQGKLFHVQTEDSGRRNPHVISHLYHGGTILASEKTRYADLLDLESETLTKDVRALIEEQHKEMLKRLKRGDYDSVIASRLRGGSASRSSASGSESVTPPPTQPALDSRPPPTQPALDSAPPPAPPPPEDEGPRVFGDGIVSQKPLDEVILEYLVEKARDRAGDRESKAASRSRKKG
jgi:hypothetical protein